MCSTRWYSMSQHEKSLSKIHVSFNRMILKSYQLVCSYLWHLSSRFFVEFSITPFEAPGRIGVLYIFNPGHTEGFSNLCLHTICLRYKSYFKVLDRLLVQCNYMHIWYFSEASERICYHTFCYMCWKVC